ncbi:hypothetical protein KUCAC02_030571 [Chaenocephalus aceratus]|uniref:Uncharacterized protein n=1 Tax=Chaenocephalus aceratus TaxID=36190 RepID=A0ACB9XJW5_CHAAC|nr:hypothetical protein KUCAC02_030571 [Chaenocephalus aceratus]
MLYQQGLTELIHSSPSEQVAYLLVERASLLETSQGPSNLMVNGNIPSPLGTETQPLNTSAHQVVKSLMQDTSTDTEDPDIEGDTEVEQIGTEEPHSSGAMQTEVETALLTTTIGTSYQPPPIDLDEDSDHSEDQSDDESDDDPDWHFSCEDATTDQDDGDTDDDNTVKKELYPDASPLEDQKFLVYGSCLLKLLAICSVCFATCRVQLKRVIGSMVVFEQLCAHGHSKVWDSQPCYGTMPAGNLQIASAILFGGNSSVKILNLFRYMNIPAISLRTYSLLQTSYLIPAVENVWKRKQQHHLAALKDRPAKLGGDGIRKKLDAKGKRKILNILLMWSKSISHHVYWVASTSQVYVQELMGEVVELRNTYPTYKKAEALRSNRQVPPPIAVHMVYSATRNNTSIPTAKFLPNQEAKSPVRQMSVDFMFRFFVTIRPIVVGVLIPGHTQHITAEARRLAGSLERECSRLERDLEEGSRRLAMAHNEIRHLTDELESAHLTQRAYEPELQAAQQEEEQLRQEVQKLKKYGKGAHRTYYCGE